MKSIRIGGGAERVAENKIQIREEGRGEQENSPHKGRDRWPSTGALIIEGHDINKNESRGE